MPAITGLQIKLGRTAIGWSLRELAAAAGLSPTTITRFELGHGGLNMRSLDQLQNVLEDRGVVFVPADQEGSETVRLKR
jgi:transcriptional regulator with XRE-family HTH domain